MCFVEPPAMVTPCKCFAPLVHVLWVGDKRMQRSPPLRCMGGRQTHAAVICTSLLSHNHRYVVGSSFLRACPMAVIRIIDSAALACHVFAYIPQATPVVLRGYWRYAPREVTGNLFWEYWTLGQPHVSWEPNTCPGSPFWFGKACPRV